MSTRPVIVFMGCPHLDSDSRSGLRSALRKLARLVDTDAEVRSTRPTAEDLEALRPRNRSASHSSRACERYANRVCFRMREHAITYAARSRRRARERIAAQRTRERWRPRRHPRFFQRRLDRCRSRLFVHRRRLRAASEREAKIRICLMWSMKPIFEGPLLHRRSTGRGRARCRAQLHDRRHGPHGISR